MEKKREENTKKGKKKSWKEPDFEIHSLLDNELYIRGMLCDAPCVCDCTCDPGS